MMNGFVGMLLANENTSKSLDGLGALKGAPCILESFKDFTEGNRSGTEITFKWTSESGEIERMSFKVFNGIDGTNSDNSCECEGIQDITEEEINDICKIH